MQLRASLLPAPVLFAVLLLAAMSAAAPAHAQFGPAGPPAVGVVKAQKLAITETSDFVGRIQSTDRVDLVARVTAFIEERLFKEGAEVKKGDLLYRLERPPFEGGCGGEAGRRGAGRRDLAERHHHAESGAATAEHAGGPALHLR